MPIGLRICAQSLVGKCTYIDWMPTRPGPVNRLSTTLVPPSATVLRPYILTAIAQSKRDLIEPAGRHVEDEATQRLVLGDEGAGLDPAQ